MILTKNSSIYIKSNNSNVAYHLIYDKDKEIEASSEFDELVEDDECINHNVPYVITSEQFSESLSDNYNHDKITIYYYEEDDILVDEQEDPITDISSIIGDVALLNFGLNSNDPDIVFVRNEKISIDFEIIRYHKSYQETVLGFIDKPNIKRRITNAEE